MLKKLFTMLTILATQVYSQVCFTQQQVQTSNNLFTYKGNVYDITNYNHPGGAAKLSLTIGKSLENFVNLPQYSFHLSSPKFSSDLSRILVGSLCANTYPVSTTKSSVSTSYIGTTKAPVGTTSQVSTIKYTVSTKNNDMTSAAANINQNFYYFIITILTIIIIN